MKGKFNDLTGQQFGELHVDSFCRFREGDHAALWNCTCSCGNHVVVSNSCLVSGKTISCGCIRNSLVKERAFKHGMIDTKVYNCWKHMKSRCNNPNDQYYDRYGGRGIKVCDEWNGPDGFINFYNDFGYLWQEGYSIDRIDNDKGYYKDNCRWVPNCVQQNNKSTNVYVNYYDKDYTYAELGQRFGGGRQSRDIRSRLKSGWSLDEALRIPDLFANGYKNKNDYYTKGNKVITKPVVFDPIEFDKSLIKEDNSKKISENPNYANHRTYADLKIEEQKKNGTYCPIEFDPSLIKDKYKKDNNNCKEV